MTLETCVRQPLSEHPTMNLPKIYLFVVFGLCCQIAIANNTAEADRLKQVAEEIKARRALRTMGSADRTSLVFVKDANGIRFVAKDRLLIECNEGLESLFKRELLMTLSVASKKITLQTDAVPAAEAPAQMIRKLNEAGITVIELGEDALLLVTRSQLPKTLGAPVN